VGQPSGDPRAFSCSSALTALRWRRSSPVYGDVRWPARRYRGDWQEGAASMFGYLASVGERGPKPNFERRLAGRFARAHAPAQAALRKRGERGTKAGCRACSRRPAFRQHDRPAPADVEFRASPVDGAHGFLHPAPRCIGSSGALCSKAGGRLSANLARSKLRVRECQKLRFCESSRLTRPF
jgi:hypothetical protein